MPCNLSQALGGANCEKLYGDVRMLGISSEKVSYSTRASAQGIASVQSKIEEDQTYIVTAAVNSLDATRPEPVTETDSYSRDRDTRNTPGSDIFYTDSNPCDHSNGSNLDKSVYWVEIYFSNRFKLVSKKEDGTYEAFKGQVNVMPVGVPEFDNKIQQYRTKINWANVQQFEKVELIELVDDLTDYQELMPVGLSWEWASTYTASDRDILITLRCDNSSRHAGTLVANIRDYNVDTPAVSVSAAVDGVYTLTITKTGTPTALTSGDYIKFDLQELTAAVVDYTTETITFKVD